MVNMNKFVRMFALVNYMNKCAHHDIQSMTDQVLEISLLSISSLKGLTSPTGKSL